MRVRGATPPDSETCGDQAPSGDVRYVDNRHGDTLCTISGDVYFPASARRSRSRRKRSGMPAGSPPDARASPSRFRHMRSATHSPSTSSRRAPTCVRFSFCSGIGACRPRPATCCSPPARSARPRVRWTSFRSRTGTDSGHRLSDGRAARRDHRGEGPLRPSARLVQLLPQPPLSDLSVAGPRRVARTATGGPAAHRVLPRRLHRAPGGRRDRHPEQGRRLRSPLPSRRRDIPHDCRRPSPPRRRDRLLRRPPHLGPNARPSSASALRHPGWGARKRRQRLGCLPPRVLPAGPGPFALLPSRPPPSAAGRLRVRTAALRRPAAVPRRPPPLRRPPPPGPRDRMGGLREATLRRPRAGPRLPRPLHAPDRHQRPAPVQPRRQLRALSATRTIAEPVRPARRP